MFDWFYTSRPATLPNYITLRSDSEIKRMQAEGNRHQEEVYGKNIAFEGTWISKAEKGMAQCLVKAMGKEIAKKLIDSI